MYLPRISPTHLPYISQVLEAVPAVDAALGQSSTELISGIADDLASFESAAADASSSAALSGDGGGGGAAPEAVATFEATVAKVQAATTSLVTKMLAGIDAYAGLGRATGTDGAGGAVLAGGANTTREGVARSANLNITVQARAPSQRASEPCYG